nr:immunoglobulin heavy chain junction region [Mus musculus]
CSREAYYSTPCAMDYW